MLKTACHRFEPITIGLGGRVCSAWMPVPDPATLRIPVEFVMLPPEEWEVRRPGALAKTGAAGAAPATPGRREP